ncbi:precorrin-2 dehydrogenase/sirohydrochlorin ferrochelatase family protein [Paenibacillus tengchongensis]|uniref:precorrin-2 dehydrogenase/sirohydrochlorin ferrochelatase family protein n=1 Tax=Paenibacillus tengchongensis TaxID=2608684 RepID=UPI00124E05E8|nr:NAD(P)-dependent oxidoreductase [Paenibacillus tengchongensis]
MKKLVPVMLDLEHCRVVVVGGGTVAERKVDGLLESGASLVVVSPGLTGRLTRLAGDGAVAWVSRGYAPGDIQGAALVYAASSDAAVNAAVAREARERGIPVNVASGADAGSFITPAVLRRGRLTVAVSTSGAGPAAAVRITERLAGVLGEEYEPYLDFLHELRCEIKRREPSPEHRGQLLRRLAGLDVLEEMRQGTFTRWSDAEITAWIAANREP